MKPKNKHEEAGKICERIFAELIRKPRDADAPTPSLVKPGKYKRLIAFEIGEPKRRRAELQFHVYPIGAYGDVAYMDISHVERIEGSRYWAHYPFFEIRGTLNPDASEIAEIAGMLSMRMEDWHKKKRLNQNYFWTKALQATKDNPVPFDYVTSNRSAS